jgi:hypothetical protein
VSLDLLDQLAAYGEHHRASQPPIALFEIVAGETDVRLADSSLVASASRPGRTRLWAALAMAALVVLVVGGLVLLAGTDVRRDPTDNPTATNPTSASSTTTSIAPADSFAPFIRGQFVGEPASTTSGVESYQTSHGEFRIWSANVRSDWTIDWFSMFAATKVDGPDGLSNEAVSWDAATGILEVKWGVASARLRVSISGTPEAWTITIENPGTDESISEIIGSLPGNSLDEILEGIVPAGRIDARRLASFVVSDGVGAEFVSPPWEPVFLEGEAYHVLVVNDTLLAFLTLNIEGPGQITVWRSADGRAWEDLGPAPWSGHTNTLQSLEEVNGQVLAATRKDSVSNIDDDPQIEPGQLRYWSSVDGATWDQLTLEQWEQLDVPRTGQILP